MALKSDSSGVPQAIREDGALCGDTRNPLHYKPLPKMGPVIGPMYSSHVENDSRHDKGSGTGDGGELRGY